MFGGSLSFGLGLGGSGYSRSGLPSRRVVKNFQTFGIKIYICCFYKVVLDLPTHAQKQALDPVRVTVSDFPVFVNNRFP